jgi:ABC-type Fe3+-hydroxamate transport system substrate-binding protein
MNPMGETLRVVSLLPSATETLCLVGGSHLLVGRSHECDYPPSVQDRPILTSQHTEFTTARDVDAAVSRALHAGESLYALNEALLRDLEPHVILTQDLCEVCSIDLRTVRALVSSMNPQPAVVSLNPRSVEGVFDDILSVGEAVGLRENAEQSMVELRERLHRAADFVNPYADVGNVVFLEWTDPLYIGGHWTPQLIERAGGRHSLNETRPMEGAGSGAGGQMAHRVAGKSIRVTPEQVVDATPEWIVVCPCGLDLATTRDQARLLHAEDWWRELPAVRNRRVALVDGNQMFNRPGPRLVDAFEWLVGWLNDLPDLIPDAFPWEPLHTGATSTASGE